MAMAPVGGRFITYDKLGVIYDTFTREYLDMRTGERLYIEELSRRERSMYSNSSGYTQGGYTTTTANYPSYSGGGGGCGVGGAAGTKWYVTNVTSPTANTEKEKKQKLEQEKIKKEAADKKRKFKNLYWHRRNKERGDKRFEEILQKKKTDV